MIRESDFSDRRFFTFPAVHPCQGTSPATVLESLISLSRKLISFNSKLYASQRRMVRETLRQITILSIFFEEIHAADDVPDSITLSLSELHYSLQKIHFLLHDCSLEGTRLWILMKSHFVSTQFRVIIRSIATAVEILPLDSIRLSIEVKEILQLVGKQARNAKMEIDEEDEAVMNRVILILNQFVNRFEPSKSFIKSVLDYLKIQTWKDCQNEIKFMEKLMANEFEREGTLLSSLIGFMSYCRGVLFETGDYYGETTVDERGQIEVPNFLNLNDFLCPISLEVMNDPVTVSTGQTYDRASIGKWLKAGNLICPKTGEKLITDELVPNSSLKKLIHQFCFDNRISMAKSRKWSHDISRTIVAGSPSAMAIEFLSEFLVNRLRYGSADQKKKASYEVRLLAKTNIYNRSVLIDAGAVSPLLHLLRSSNPITQENSAAAILKLSKHAGGRKLIIENDGHRSIMEILKHGLKPETKQISAAIIFYLSSVKDDRITIGEMPDLIPSLFALVPEGSVCMKKNSLAAIFALILNPRNRQKVIEIGAVPLLLDLITSAETDEIKTESLAILSILAQTREGSSAIFAESCLPRLVDTLNNRSSSRSAKEYSLSAIVSMCKNLGNEVISSISNDSSLMGSLYSMLTEEGTANAGKKVRTLIKILHRFREMDEFD